MKGVVLAGGNGTRLRPATYVYNKHLALVYDKPMIYYPIQTLIDMGCDDIIIVSGGDHIGGFTELLQDGSELGVRLTYRVQTEAGGIAQALNCVNDLHGLFPVILGDNFFAEAPKMPKTATIYTRGVPDPERFGVYQDGKIIEKPSNPKTDQAVTGLYVFDDWVFKIIPRLKPSARGELEVTDINNKYLENNLIDVVELKTGWKDMGTFNSLLEVANYVKAHV